MGQYWYPVNLTKRECIHPHKLGAGLKLWEQLAASPGVGAALIILCAAMPEPRGGGDFDLDENWHGPERTFPKHNVTPGPMPEDYAAIAKRTIGRWAGDRIALVGDYAKDTDLAPDDHASTIYERCQPQTRDVWNNKPAGAEYRSAGGAHAGKYLHIIETAPAEFRDISADVARVIEHELQGRYTGTGWREWTPDQNTTETPTPTTPDRA